MKHQRRYIVLSVFITKLELAVIDIARKKTSTYNYSQGVCC